MSILAGFFVPHPPLIVPDVGRGQERIIENTIQAYQEIAHRIQALEPDTIILSSPHAPAYRDHFHLGDEPIISGTLARFGAPTISSTIRADSILVRAIQRQAELEGLPLGPVKRASSELDHGSLVPLYFLGSLAQKVRFVRISPSGLSLSEHYQIGRLVSKVVPSNQRVVWLASGDLSHTLKEDGPYGKTEEGPVFDQRFTEMIKQQNLQAMFEWDPLFCDKAAVCGLGSFAMMAGALDGTTWKGELLSYEGPFGVGYAVASFIVQESVMSQPIEQGIDPYIRLAQSSLEYYLRHKKNMSIPADLPQELLDRRHGVFVSIHKQGSLRGCIGTIHPTQTSVAEEIIHNAIAAGTRDYRFRPIAVAELDHLEYHVDVLYPPEPIASKEELDVIRYGVIVRRGYRSGLLLPNLDGIDTVDEQVDIACRKAGISPHEPHQLERFEVIRHE
jgi:AmmeMemoRadiSam system protein A/AmmeMemoRadiSam system protein B